MKFIPNTVPKPVVGKEAEKLTAALQKGGHVANRTALETTRRIVRLRATPRPPGWSKPPPWSRFGVC